MSESNRACFLCNHPLRGTLDGLIDDASGDGIDDTQDILDKLNSEIGAVYGSHARMCDADTLQVHLGHDLVVTGTNIRLADDKQMIRMGDREYNVPTVEEAIVAILACGIHNLRMRPDLVTPHHMLRALQELRQSNISFEEGTLEDKILEKMQEIEVVATGPMRPPE